jgi:hypothetical protein
MRNIDALDKAASPKPWGIIATALWGLLTLFLSDIVLVPTLVLLTGGKLSQSSMRFALTSVKIIAQERTPTPAAA